MKLIFTLASKSRFFALIILCFSSLLHFKSKAQDSPKDYKNRRVAAAYSNEPQATDELFVEGTGYNYDQYLFRKDLPNGRMKLGVNITRFYTNAMQFDSQGFLTNAPELIKKGLIPAEAFLAINIFDVDDKSQYDGNGDGIADPEVDHVYVNGNLIKVNGKAKELSSGDQTWSTFSCYIPIEYLKFPTRMGDKNTSPKAENIVEIDVDVPNTTYWAVQCDWVSIKIKNTIRPIVFVRGWSANSSATALKTWKPFMGFADRDGIPYHLATTIEPSGGIGSNSLLIKKEIILAKKKLGVQKVNIVAHSKGGLDSRLYLRSNYDVENLVQIGTPNHGSEFAAILNNEYSSEAFKNLDPDWLANHFNYLEEKQEKALYLKELNKETKIYQIVGNYRGILTRFDGDGVVSFERATLPWLAYYKNYPFDFGNLFGFGKLDLTKPINIINDGSFALGHNDLVESNEVYQRAIFLINSKIVTQTIKGGRLQSTESLQTPTVNTDTLAIVFLQAGKVKALGTSTYKAYLPITGVASFQGVLTNINASFSLKSPTGKIYNSSSTEYSFIEDFALHNFAITKAESGEWEITVKGGDADTPFTIKTIAQSTRKIVVSTEKYNYLPDEAITIKVNGLENNLPFTGGNGMVYLFKGTTKDSVQVFDDGLHNDEKANDGIYANKHAGFRETGFVSLVVKLQKGLESTFDEASVYIKALSGTFTDKYSEQVFDENYDNLYDSLQIKVGINVKIAGSYMVMGSLKDSKGNLLATASWNTNASPLAVGNHDAILNFNGEAIGRGIVDGPYILDDLVMIDNSNSNIVDSRDSAYITEPYKRLDFTRPPIQLTGKNTETPIDIDNDGDYDYLDIKIQVDVTQSGYYSVNAELLDSLQNSLNWAVNETYFYAGLNEITLRFSGEEINEKLANGPYLLTNLYFDSYYAAKTFFDVYKTSKYLFSNFTGNIITGKVKDSYTGLGVEDATVILKGTKLATVKTDKNGAYALAGLPNGYYTLEVQKDNYCPSKITKINYLQANIDTSLMVTSQKIALHTSKEIQICQGDSIKFALPTGLTNYKWSTGSTNAGITVKNAGTFYATALKEECQIKSDTVRITLAVVPKPTITTDGMITLTSSLADSYQWFNNNVIITGATNRTYVVNNSGKYSVKISKNGCSNISDYFNFIITAEEPKLNIIPVKMYPNPNNGSFWIEVPETLKTWQINVTDVKGSVVFTNKYTDNSKVYVDTALPTGIYLISITSERKHQVIKFVVK
ncbi:carboxypeptidase regulatory-like domain-containing protein [Arcicella aquatica]|uniref:Carboxypeptidase regulatory-like domain-containing protein n=1 Tax=Arcicella aquatica TaxID=217141 RepID=A0ABU5QV44_9BACT|nr:carboxypeptidase regulatory-like domain-containing protein [Arcicella aquatica]MEA5260972.1 carboxypeptidase regulatory-like domain-containing protein [Arcicella aquatica]